jgi:hypothetical protein
MIHDDGMVSPQALGCSLHIACTPPGSHTSMGAGSTLGQYRRIIGEDLHREHLSIVVAKEGLPKGY